MRRLALLGALCLLTSTGCYSLLFDMFSPRRDAGYDEHREHYESTVNAYEEYERYGTRTSASTP